jgi:tetratricopeptide (TPR) repeat protein/predicted aspartyl protease
VRVFAGIVLAFAMSAVASAAHAADNHCSIGTMFELPVTIINRQPTVAVELDGHKMRLILDSGAVFSSLSPSAAAAFGFKLRNAPFGLRLQGVGGEVRPSLTTVDKFTLGGKTLRHVEFLVGGSETGASGLLGQNVLGMGDVEYDLANGVVRLMKPEHCRGANLAYWAHGKPVSIEDIGLTRYTDRHTWGDVELNGVRLNAMFDTGAATSIVSLRAAERAGVRRGDPGVTDAGGVGGIGQGGIQTWIGPFDSLRIGDNETIRKIKLRFGDIDPRGRLEMVIGADFFLSHRVYVSNTLHKMFFTYNGGPVFDLSIHHGEGKAPELTSAAAYSGRGMASLARHDYARARDDLTSAIALAPGEARYYTQRAAIELASKDDKAAAADLDAALARAPGDVRALFARARLRLRGDDKMGARKDAEAIDGSLGKPSDQRFALAELYDALGLVQPALAQYGLWIDAHPHDSKLAIAFNNRCWLRATRGTDFAAAVDDCDHALHFSPHEAGFLDSRGLAYLRLGKLDKAIDDYDDALRTAPKQASSLYGRGVAQRRLGRTTKGDADIARAKALDPDTVRELQKDGVVP